MKVPAAGSGVISPAGDASRRVRARLQNSPSDLRRKLKRVEITVKMLKAGRNVGKNLDLEA